MLIGPLGAVHPRRIPRLLCFRRLGKCSLESWSAQFLESSYASSGSKFTAGGSAIDMRLTGDLSGKKLAIKPEGMSFHQGRESLARRAFRLRDHHRRTGC